MLLFPRSIEYDEHQLLTFILVGALAFYGSVE